jgi:hypothetical protein
MSSAPRNPDKLNTIGIVVVGVCGAVLVYVSIVALQAFYMTDTSGVQTMADYGGQDSTSKSIKATQLGNISEYGKNALANGKPDSAQTYKVPIDRAMALVLDNVKTDPAALIPGMRSDQPSVAPIYGRPRPLPTPSQDPSGAGSAAPAAAGSGAAPAAGSGAAPAAGSPAGNLAPMVPTGSTTAPSPASPSHAP